MNKHRILILIGIFFTSISSPLKAQKPAFETGIHTPPPEVTTRYKNRYCPIFASATEVFVSDWTNDGVMLTAYDAQTLKKQRSFPLKDPKVNGYKPDLYKWFFKGDDITSIYSIYNHKDKNIVYGRKTNSDNKVLVDEKVLASFNASSKNNIGTVGIKSSDDKSKILIFREAPVKSSPEESIQLWLYDEQLESIYKKKLTFPYKNKQFAVQDYLVTNTGKVVIVATYTASKEEGSNYKLFGVNEGSEVLEEIKFIPEGKVLSAMYACILDSGRSLVCSGFCRDDNKLQYGATGIYYTKINTNTWEQDITQFNKIPDEEMNNIFARGQSDEKVKGKVQKYVDKGFGIEHAVVKDIYYNKDGTIKIVARNESMQKQCRSDQGGSMDCKYIYSNMEIIEFDLDAKARLTKMILVPKDQSNEGRSPEDLATTDVIDPPLYLGNIVLASPTKLYYVYNDNSKNSNKAETDRQQGNKFFASFYSPKNSNLVYACQSDKSDKTIKKIMGEPDPNSTLILCGSYVLNMPDGSVIVWGKADKSKEQILMRFYLKQE
jgi:hypothetical protein